MVVPELMSKFITDKNGQTLVKVSYNDVYDNSVTKTISLEDYINLLKGATTFEKEADEIKIGALPKGFVDGSVSSDGSLKAIIKIDKNTHFFALKEDSIQKNYFLPFPRLLFFLSTGKNGKIISGNVFAIKDEEIKENTIFYQYPFGNVNSSGSICFGNINEKATCLKEMDNIIFSFFNSITSSHYYNSKIYSCLNLSQLALAEHLSTLKEFPDEILIPSAGEYRDYKSMYHAFFNNK